MASDLFQQDAVFVTVNSLHLQLQLPRGEQKTRVREAVTQVRRSPFTTHGHQD